MLKQVGCNVLILQHFEMHQKSMWIDKGINTWTCDKTYTAKC